jgi:hypothetical protein
MRIWISSAVAFLALTAFMVGNSAAYPGSGNSGSGNSGGGNTGSGGGGGGGHSSSSGGGSGGHSSSSGSSGSSGRSSSNGGSSNGNDRSRNSNSSGHSSNNGSIGSGGGNNSIHINSGNKTVLKSNPAPKIVNSNTSKNALSDKDHSKDHSKDHGSKDNGSKSTSHDHSNHNDKDHHYHSNPKYTYHHEHGQHWDKDEWNHCWNRWWCFHNNHVFYNGAMCWWDPDVSQWSVYNEGDTIPEDYLVKDEAPPAASDSIRIASPADAGAPLGYTLNEYSFEIKPGDHQDLTTDRTWVISFNRGGDFGDAEYTLDTGEYTFGPSDHGWELFHTSATDEATQSSAPESSLPKNPLPK